MRLAVARCWHVLEFDPLKFESVGPHEISPPTTTDWLVGRVAAPATAEGWVPAAGTTTSTTVATRQVAAPRATLRTAAKGPMGPWVSNSVDSSIRRPSPVGPGCKRTRGACVPSPGTRLLLPHYEARLFRSTSRPRPVNIGATTPQRSLRGACRLALTGGRTPRCC